ncbi:hypothetical protein Ciccas_014125, partial [Cichlidogyrus casuarinus]
EGRVQMKPEFYPTSTSCGYVIPGVRMMIDCSTQKLDPFEDKAIGEIYLESPFIPSIGKTIWRDDKRWIETYFSKKGYYSCFDYGSISADSLVNIYGHEMAISNMVREKIRSVHPLLRHFRACAFVPALPRNRNGKVMRFILNDIVNQKLSSRASHLVSDQLLKSLKSAAEPHFL